MSSLNIVVCMHVCISGLIIENSTIEQAFMYTGLTPYTQYYIHVMAKSSGAIGPAAVNNITTLAEGKVHIHTHKFTWHQNEGVPWRHTYPYPNLNLIRNKATSASDRRPFRSLSSLQRWKADPIFTRVLLLALLFRRCFPLLFFICHLYLSVTWLCCSLKALSVISEKKVSPSYHE